MAEPGSKPSDGTPPVRPSGQLLGDYRLLRRLGEGAMAKVYLAEQKSLRRPVAVKILRARLASDATYVKRLHYEAMAAASLIHANIVQIYQVGRVKGVYFIAQEYVPGENLGQRLQRQGPVSVKTAVAVMRQVAAALAKAAEHHIVHRDIKPENIMLARSGEVKVADFGLARKDGTGVGLTEVGVTMGTPLYMSPEQIEGRLLDTRSDIYSLGVTCYHMLSGHPPFVADTALAVAVHHLNTPPKDLKLLRANLPEGLCGMVRKMLNKRPEDRYQSPSELLADLRALVHSGAGQDWAEELGPWDTGEQGAPAALPTNPTVRLDRLMKTSALVIPQRANWKGVAAAAALCGVLGLAVAMAVRPRSRLTDVRAAPIPERQSAWGQLYLAKMTDTPRAWRAVWEYFPDDAYARNLAKQGLVRHHLGTGQVKLALPHLRDLANLGETEVRFRGFGLAGECIVLNLLDRTDEAMTALEQLTPEMSDQLSPSVRRMLIETVSRHRDEIRGRAKEAFEWLKEAGAAEDIGEDATGGTT